MSQRTMARSKTKRLQEELNTFRKTKVRLKTTDVRSKNHVE